MRSVARARQDRGAVRIRDLEWRPSSSQAGSIRAAGVPVEGDSRITCLAGSVRLHLGRGSDVRVRARAQMGKVRIEGARRSESTGIGSSTEELVLGEGRASLEIDASMGSIRVETE